jgi:integrase
MECLRLRVKDLDFDRGQITVRDGKGGKDRVTVLPERCREPLREHLARVRARHEEDRRRGVGEVHLPPALERKYANAPKEWAWQRVFPAGAVSDRLPLSLPLLSNRRVARDGFLGITYLHVCTDRNSRRPWMPSQ